MGNKPQAREGTIQVNGAKVKRLREAKGWSREALRKETERLSREPLSPKVVAITSERPIERIETGNAGYLSTVFAIATALGVGVEDLRTKDSLHQFAAFIEDRTQRFVGRDFVFAAIEVFQADNPCGYFLIEGDPGAGKSTLLAEFVRRSKCIHHFNSQALGVTSVAQFLKSIGEQLISEFALPYADVPSDSLEDGRFLSSLLKQASEKLGTGKRLVIAVDALDEVDASAVHGSSNPLFLPPILPERVHFVITSRRQCNRAFAVQSVLKTFDLTQYEPETRKDISSYVDLCLSEGDLNDYISAQKIGTKELKEALIEKSELNFMYLVHVLPLLQEGEALHDRSLDQIPAGLQGYYDDHWRRMRMTDSPLPQAKLDVIYALSIVKRPTPRRMIAEALKTDAVAVQLILDEWMPFLHVDLSDVECGYSLYHSSFRDFLHRKDIVQAAGLELKGVKARFAKYLLDRWKKK